jgi:hypothetical protein
MTRRRLRSMAKSRIRLNARDMSGPKRSKSIPLACPIMTRRYRAVCWWLDRKNDLTGEQVSAEYLGHGRGHRNRSSAVRVAPC